MPGEPETVITKPREHDIDREGKQLLRNALESLGWVVNEVQEDYAIDYNVQVFDEGSPTGAQLVVTPDSSSPQSSASTMMGLRHPGQQTT